MKKTVGYLDNLFRKILFIGFSIQIIFGLVWMCFHFMDIQVFGEPEGLLYPLLLRVFGSVPQFLYLLQLSFAWFAAATLLKPMFRKKTFLCPFCALALLTLPFAMQCHLALLPYSFVSSFLFLEVSFCRGSMQDERGVKLPELAGGAVCWLALFLLLPEYGFLGGVPLVFSVLFRLPALVKQLRRMIYCLLIIVAFGGMIAGVGSLADMGGREERNFWFSLAHRTAWPTVWQDADKWPEELRAIAEPVLWETTYYPGNMEELLKPVVEQAAGEELAKAYYRLMAVVAWQNHSSVIIRQMAWDAFVYMLPQIMLPIQLEGRGYDSYSGRNYEIMLGRQPRLSRYYVDYSCWWFVVAFGIATLLAAVRVAAGERRIKRGTLGFLVMCALSAGAVMMHYIMRGSGMSDYKCTLAVSAVWTVWMLYSMGWKRLDERE